MKQLLVAIPLWPGDHAVVARNLERQCQRDGQVQHQCLLAIDLELWPRRKEWITLAQACFSRVEVMCVGVHTRTWPEAQNRVWQQIARHIEETKYECAGWFLWESDALPIKPKWLDTLCHAYTTGKGPFLGHVVPERGHMNAVAVYPLKISPYAWKCLLTKQAPFDVALSEEVKGQNVINARNDLIAHHLKVKGGDPAKSITQSILDALPASTVIVHGYTEPVVEIKPSDPKTRREIAMQETSKAMRRRFKEDSEGKIPWRKYFIGKGIDVGAGNDPVMMAGCKPFDIQDGDANKLSTYFPNEHFNYIHASQSLEHMHNPKLALLDWAKCLKKGGYIVATVPSWWHYEKFHWPSRFNGDHKTAWSMELRADRRCPVLIHIPTFMEEMEKHGLRPCVMRLVDTNYDYLAPDDVDQTLGTDQAEAFYEMVFQKA